MVASLIASEYLETNILYKHINLFKWALMYKLFRIGNDINKNTLGAKLGRHILQSLTKPFRTRLPRCTRVHNILGPRQKLDFLLLLVTAFLLPLLCAFLVNTKRVI